ncbi:MAG: hypothetical protein HY721_27535 [Planctomycetes bacterium]|nr:hypothetical protein [Planctomycetota bacterium]
MSHEKPSGKIARWLAAAPAPAFVLYAVAASFSAYFCMYAFRKPFTAAQYSGERLGEVELKTALVISQIFGYAVSKFLGIKVCSEATRNRRARTMVLLVLWAEAALVLFAVVPPPLKVVAIFLNGLPLGMVWGLVVWYLEGRRTSELLLAGLSCSFIVASGAVKDVGRLLISRLAVPEVWMPALTGLLFLPVFLVSVWLLNQVPPPSAADAAARVLREPMDAGSRRSFLRAFLPGIVLLVVAYFFLTAYRDFRDNYAVEIAGDLGLGSDSTVLTRMELIVAFAVIVPLALLVLVRDNRAGLLGAYGIMTLGVALLGAVTLAFDAGHVSGFWWLTLVGLGAYLAYVPYGSVLFDRLMASTRFVGTAVFAIYVADAIGYCGSVLVQLGKDFGWKDISRLEFLRGFTYFMSALGLACLLGSCLYFHRVSTRRQEPSEGSQHDSMA